MDYKYKVGDAVIIRGDLNNRTEYYMRSGPHANIEWTVATNDMCERQNQMCHIKATIRGHYILQEDPNEWDWTDDMFEDVSDKECFCTSLL